MSAERFGEITVSFLLKICHTSGAGLHKMHVEWSQELESGVLEEGEEALLRGYLAAVEKELAKRPKEQHEGGTA